MLRGKDAIAEKVEAEGYGNSKPPPLVILSMLRGMDTITEKVEAEGYGNSGPQPFVNSVDVARHGYHYGEG